MIERAGSELRLSGALTIANAAALCEEGKQQLNGDVVIDLAAVTEVDEVDVLEPDVRRRRQRKPHMV